MSLVEIEAEIEDCKSWVMSRLLCKTDRISFLKRLRHPRRFCSRNSVPAGVLLKSRAYRRPDS